MTLKNGNEGWSLRHLLLVVLALILIPTKTCEAEDTGVTVTITQKAPIESISATGDITGVTESTVGAKMTWVSTDGAQLTLQDAQKAHYRIALAATDYTPPPTAPFATTNNVPNPASKPPSNFPVTSVPNSSSPFTNVVTISAPANNLGMASEGVMTTVVIGEQKDVNLMAVWPQGGLADSPLLIACSTTSLSSLELASSFG